MRRSVRKQVREKQTGNGMKAAFLAVAVLAAAGVVFYFGSSVRAAQGQRTRSPASRRSASSALSLPKSLPSTHSRAAVLRAQPGSDRSSGQVPRARLRLRSVSDRRRSSARNFSRTALNTQLISARSSQPTVQFGDSHAAGRSELFGSRFRRFAAAGQEQLLYWQRSVPSGVTTFRSLPRWSIRRFIRASIWFTTATRDSWNTTSASRRAPIRTRLL